MNTMTEKLDAFKRMLTIMDELREQCPWDRKQTMESLRNLTIEETYELADAILDEDLQGVKEELGDLMLHIVFYARIGREKGAFDVADLIHAECDKLVHRHPHIYGDTKVTGEEEVKQNWEKLKLKEGKKSVLQGVPKSLPAMVKAQRIQEKSAQVGFEWDKTGDVWDKVKEEMGELQQVANQFHNQTKAEGAKPDAATQEKIEEEMGDLFFSLVNYSRFLNVEPETALERTNRKFIKRFTYIESKAEQQGKLLDEMSLEEMDQLWNEAKKLS